MTEKKTVSINNETHKSRRNLHFKEVKLPLYGNYTQVKNHRSKQSTFSEPYSWFPKSVMNS